MIAAFADRRFQLWEYRVSHGSLLVRSPRRAGLDSTVDVLFHGVEYLAVPRHLDGVEVDHGSDTDAASIRSQTRRFALDRLFVVMSRERRHLVVAAAVTVRQHDEDLFSSPFSRE